LKKWIAQLSASVFLVSYGAPAATAETITFDHPPCAPISPGVYPGDCYASVGLSLGSLSLETFTGINQFEIAADPSSVSAPNVARALPSFTTLTASFFIPPPGHGFGTSTLSFNVTGSVPGQSPWEAIFVGMESEMQRTSGTDRLVSLSPAGVAVHGPAFVFGFTRGSASQGIDNLAFGADGASPTPEPATLLLMATGGVALLRRRRC